MPWGLVPPAYYVFRFEPSRFCYVGWTSARWGRLTASAMRGMLEQIDPAAHNGAPLLGLNGVVVKSHGSADVHAMTRAILEAGREARRKVPEKISASMRSFEMEK